MTKSLTLFSLKVLALIISITFSVNTLAIPKITTIYGKNNDGFSRVKIINETTANLACYIALDGRKIKFKLPVRAHSRWYKATDRRFSHTDFSIWCDYIELHPEYEQYIN